jgi:arylsulfatase A-like enzyme
MPSSRPNILFLTTDQQRFDCLGINSNGFVQTPNLDALAREGANLLRFYVNNPLCMPSRASLLTGKYPRNHSVTCNGIPLSESIPNIAHALGAAGYVTGNLGKLHFLPHSGRDYTEPHPDYGFHVVVNADEPGCYPDAYIQWIRSVAPEMEEKVRVPTPGVEPRGSFDRWIFDAPEELSYSAWVADETIKFIDSNPDRPWFAIAGLYLPHAPATRRGAGSTSTATWRYRHLSFARMSSTTSRPYFASWPSASFRRTILNGRIFAAITTLRARWSIIIAVA